MKASRRQLLRFTTAAAALCATSSIGATQPYPSRPVVIIVPVPPGGVADPIARILADHLTLTLGHPVVIENVTGAGGSIGVARLVRAAPDGHTLGIGNWLSHVGASAVYPVQYDVLEDLAPVSLLTRSPILITARKDFPANDLNELIAWLKANPGKATVATVGRGSAGHVSSFYFGSATGTRFAFVPYRGGGPAIQDELAGHVDLMFNEGTGALPYVLSGQIKAYAVLAKSRWFAAPTSRPSQSSAFPESRFCSGMGCGSPRARRRRSFRSSTPQWSKHSAIRLCASDSPPSARRSFHARSRRRKRSTPFTKPRSRNGGRSSGRPAPAVNKRRPA